MTPLLATASEAINERMQQSFKAQAFQEVQSEIDSEFIVNLKMRPMQLVGMEVPSVRPGAPASEKVRILDTQMARDWQETVTGLIEDEIEDKVRQKAEEVRPMTSVIQESVLLFQNNPDLIIGTKGFDRELAERFVRLAKAYEVKTAQGTLGYGVNVQPLINEIRADLAKERGADGARTEARTEQQRQQALSQPRTEGGQFDAPQAGISSKSGMSGEPADDYSTFWAASGLAGNPNLNI